jgi:AraC family transcriptional activator of pobA
MQNTLPLLSIEKSISSYKHLLKPNPDFGMDFFAEGFEPKEIVLLEDNAAGSQGIPLRFNYYALILRLKGASRRTVNQFDYHIQPQSLQLINPESTFSFEDSSDVAKTYVLLFDKSFIEKSNLEEQISTSLLEFHKQHQEDVLLNMRQFAQVLNIYEQLDFELQTKKCGYKCMIKMLINQLLFLLQRNKKELKTIQKQTRAEQICAEFLCLVQEHYCHKKSLKEYARLLDMTPKHLSQTVKATLHHTALYYIHMRLIKEMQYLLCFSDMPIKQIAHALNFQTPSQMGRFFKHHEGISPRQYRMKNTQRAPSLQLSSPPLTAM